MVHHNASSLRSIILTTIDFSRDENPLRVSRRSRHALDKTSYLAEQKSWCWENRDSWGTIADGVLYQISKSDNSPFGHAGKEWVEDGKLVLNWNNQFV